MARIVDSKVEDNYIGVLPKERRYSYRGWVIIDCGYSSAPYSIEDYPYAKEFRTLEEAKAFIRKELSDSKKTEDSKARDLVNDSKELVVGKWYDFAKKIEVERNQYATSLRISGKSGNVYRYTIYLKNGEVYGSGTYSEIKERFNIKDNAVHDSKEMTMSDAIKMLNIVDAYKKAKHR